MADAAAATAHQHDDAGDEQPANKRARLGQLATLRGFTLDKVLREDPQARLLALQGRFEGSEDPALVILAQKQLPAEPSKISDLMASSSTTLDFSNDIYSKYLLTPDPSHMPPITLDITYPATAKHLAKATAQPFHIVHETPELYRTVTLPFITSFPPERISWVYNILDKKKEVDRLIFEDPDPDTGFMMHPDLKWDQLQTGELYCLAMVLRRDLRSVRDLNATHLPLLRNIRDKGCKALQERYGTAPDQLRVFLHYQPSYYHLHVHFVALSLGAAAGSVVGKALLIDDVIDNIETFGSDFYARKTLTYTLGEQDELWGLMRAAATAAGAGAAGEGQS